MKKWNTIAAVALTALMSFTSASKSALGLWITIDDETNKAKSVVEIFKKDDGKYYGKIIKLIDRTKADKLCTDCTDDRKDQKIEGMEIVRDLELVDGELVNGTILDPKIGKIYKCKMWVDEDNEKYLRVRGYAGPFYRTQQWLRKE